MGRNSEKLVANQALKNLDRLNERTYCSFSVFPSTPEDEEMEASATIRRDNYEMRGTLFLGQNKQVQFENQGDGVHVQLETRHY